MKFIYWLFLIIPAFTWAQKTNDILQTREFEPGFYLSFEEFRRNAPSIPADIALKSDGKLNGVKYYKLTKDYPQFNKIAQKQVWGVAIKDTVYVAVSVGYGNTRFVRMEALGRYCYFKVGNLEAIENASALAGLVGMTIAMISTQAQAILLDANIGKVQILENENLEKILEKDPELLEQYQQSNKRNKTETMLEFVHLYNQKYTHEILPPPAPKKVKLYVFRWYKQESPEALSISINGREIGQLKEKEFIELDLDDPYHSRLCVNGESFCMDHLSEKEILYIKCSQLKNAQGAINLEILDPRNGELSLNYLKHLREKSE